MLCRCRAVGMLVHDGHAVHVRIEGGRWRGVALVKAAGWRA